MDAGKSGYSQVWIPGTDTENRFIERRNEYTVFALSRCFIQVQYMLVVVLYSYIRTLVQYLEFGCNSLTSLDPPYLQNIILSYIMICLCCIFIIQFYLILSNPKNLMFQVLLLPLVIS